MVPYLHCHCPTQRHLHPADSHHLGSLLRFIVLADLLLLLTLRPLAVYLLLSAPWSTLLLLLFNCFQFIIKIKFDNCNHDQYELRTNQRNQNQGTIGQVPESPAWERARTGFTWGDRKDREGTRQEKRYSSITYYLMLIFNLAFALLVSIGLKVLKSSGILDAYQGLLVSLCKYGLPTEDLYEFSALNVLKHEKKLKV